MLEIRNRHLLLRKFLLEKIFYTVYNDVSESFVLCWKPCTLSMVQGTSMSCTMDMY